MVDVSTMTTSGKSMADASTMTTFRENMLDTSTIATDYKNIIKIFTKKNRKRKKEESKIGDLLTITTPEESSNGCSLTMSISKESLNGDVLTLPTGEKSKNGEVFNMSTSGESIQNVSTLPTSIERMADISTNNVSDVEHTNGVGEQYLIMRKTNKNIAFIHQTRRICLHHKKIR